MKNYEKELPDGYKEVCSLDAASVKVGVIFSIVALVITLLIAVPMCYILLSKGNFEFSIRPSTLLLLSGSMLLYIVLHELTHGAAYYLLTHQKLTYGFTLSVAFCGVPNIYTTKRTALISLLAPFVVFNVVFLLGVFLCPELEYKLMSAVLFALHFGGCVGDLHATYLLLFKLKGDILMKDTGPKQTYYAKIVE